MNQVVFDTHAFVKRLTAAGMPEAQAEVLADEQARLIDERLATKTDLQENRDLLKLDLRELEGRLRESELKLRGEIRESEMRLQAKIDASRTDVVKWTVGVVGLQTLVLLGALVTLAKSLH